MNADCHWLRKSAGSLSAELEFAGDLAIRCEDKHLGHSRRYVAEPVKCGARLHQQIASQRQVSTESVLAAIVA